MFALKSIGGVIVRSVVPWASTGGHYSRPFVLTQSYIANHLVSLVIQSLHLLFDLVTQNLGQIRRPFFAVNHFVQFVIYEFLYHFMHVLWIELPLRNHPISWFIFLGRYCNGGRCPLPLRKPFEELLGRQHTGQRVSHLLGSLIACSGFFRHGCYAVSPLLADASLPFHNALFTVSRRGGLSLEVRRLLLELLLRTRFHFCQHVYLVYLWVGLADNHQGLYIDSKEKKMQIVLGNQ